VRLIGGIEHNLACSQHGGSLSKVHHSRGKQAQTRVAMLVVVPGKELLAESATVLDTAEAIRELGTVLQSPELAF